MSIERLGVVVPPVGPWAEQERSFRWAEDVGYDVAYTYDHITHPTSRGEWLSDGFTTLTAAALTTTRIEVGTLVASATLHSPVSLARRAITVQDVSGGRVVLGLGAGAPLCSAADRGEHPTPGDMSRRYRDVLEGYLAVLAGETAWEGVERRFDGLESSPRPDGLHDPFLLLAAHGPKALELAARYGDGWNTYGGPGSIALDPDDFWELLGRQVAGFEEQCRRVDRDPAGVRRSLLLGFGKVRPAASASSYAEAIERAGSMGFDELVVYGPHSPAGMGSDPAVHEQVLAGRG